MTADKIQKPVEDAEGQLSPFEQLATLSLDAADAANASAETAQLAISKLDRVVRVTEETTRSIKRAPLIFGAMILGVGMALGVTIAIVMSRLSERVDGLNATISAQERLVEDTRHALKDLSQLEENLKKFEKVADETTQRAVITLREQVRTDRVALQQLEVKRLNEMLASLKGSLPAAGRQLGSASAPGAEDSRLSAIEKSLRTIDADRLSAMDKSLGRLGGRIEELSKSLGAGEGKAGLSKAAAAMMDGQSKELRGLKDDIAALKVDLAAVKGLLERKPAEAAGAVPSFKRQ